jgi:hypothetical protein
VLSPERIDPGPYTGARAANAYSLGHDRHTFAESFALKRCRGRPLQYWSANENLRPLTEMKFRPRCNVVR